MKILVTGGSGFIGRHLVPYLHSRAHQVMSVDISPPGDPSQRSFWREGSILEPAGLARIFDEYRPDAVIHLAALAVMEGRSLDDFKENTEGTANVLSAIRQIGGVQRLIVTSSQHVRRPGSGPARGDEDYAPLGLYGESKVVTERLTREAGLPGHWMIIRPTAVWGPHHPHMVEGVYRLMYRGLYLHPSRDDVVRAYGYVDNVVWQIGRILEIPATETHGRTLYVGDENMPQRDWINVISRALCGRDARTIPKGLIAALAVIGDGVRYCGLPFPIYTSRYRNLVTGNPVPMEPAFKLLGRGPHSLEQAVATTAKWLKSHYQSARPDQNDL